MPSRFSRRSIVGSLGAVAAAGCLGSAPGEPSSGPDGNRTEADPRESDDVPARCDVAPRSEQGRGDPIETTVETVRPDDVEAECGYWASDAAFRKTDDRLDLEFVPAPSAIAPWIRSSFVERADGDRVEIGIVAEKSSEATGDGSYNYCPPPEYDFDEFVQAVPSEVTVTVRFDTDDGEYECTHDVWVEQRQSQVD
ncbi:hypothetical protein ACFQDG_06270 [Natronoarchaeum mannanilyticum]|uniref:Uncharacterized protein n=1 Tax=Natronoarchaeum mannanilyticum TaxID=926360 RepID=A0AAV3T989_9EURY